jgi:hypothetical protein
MSIRLILKFILFLEYQSPLSEILGINLSHKERFLNFIFRYPFLHLFSQA